MKTIKLTIISIAMFSISAPPAVSAESYIEPLKLEWSESMRNSLQIGGAIVGTGIGGAVGTAAVGTFPLSAPAAAGIINGAGAAGGMAGAIVAPRVVPIIVQSGIDAVIGRANKEIGAAVDTAKVIGAGINTAAEANQKHRTLTGEWIITHPK